MLREKRDVKFQVVLTRTEDTMLGALALKTGLNKSIVVRQALLSSYTMTMVNQPTCANGRVCACPQFVAQQPAPAAQDALLADAAAAGEAHARNPSK